MLIKEFNQQTKSIFIHIPKVAGVSIESAIYDGGKVGHHTALEYFNEDQVKFCNYFTFCFVRSPYERLASAFFFLRAGGRNNFDRCWAEKNLVNHQALEEFVLALEDDVYRKTIFHGTHFRPQHQFVCDRNDEIMVDFVGRFECLQNGFSEICSRLGLNTVLRHKNATAEPRDYRSLYTEKMSIIVENLYQKDFHIFKYPLGYANV